MARILVVEDNHSSAQVICLFLVQEGHQVEQAYDGGEAMLKMGTFQPDLVVMDLMMPVINGWEMLDSKSRSDEVKDIPVVVLTGWSAVPHAIPENQSCVVLTKPVEPTVLVSEIKKLLNGKVPK